MLPLWSRLLSNSFLYLLQVFGLFLPFDFVTLTLHESKLWIKQVYTVFLSVLLVLSYIFLEWLDAKTIFKVIRTSSIILTTLLYTTLTSICLISILGNVFWNKENWFHYLKLHKILESQLQLELKRNKLHFSLEFLLGHFAFIVVTAVDQWRNFVHFNGELTHIIATTLKEALLYYIFLITLVIFNAALLLRSDFIALKSYLAASLNIEANKNHLTFYKPLESDLVFPRLVIGEKTLFRLLEASKILNILFECVEIFNRLFGVVTLLINFCTVLAILQSLNTLLIAGEKNLLTTDVVLSCVCEAVIFIVWNSFIISACGLLKEEPELIVKLCCKLQHLLPQLSQERKELLNLANQANRKSPTISASGFFVVDFSLFFSIFTFVGTYIVVLIQFSYMDF